MAAQDPNPALRTELVTALATLAPMIRGLHDLIATPGISADLSAALVAQVTDLQRRHDLIQTVLTDLDQAVSDLRALGNDGYPTMPVVTISSTTATELQNAMADLTAASAIFETAVAASFNQNAPHTDVPQPVPSQS